MAGTLGEYIAAVDDIRAGFEAAPQVYDKDVALELIESLKAAFTGDGFGPSDLTAFRRHTIDTERKIKEKEFIGTREEVRRKQRAQIDELWRAMSKSFEAHTNSSTDNIAVQNAKRIRILAKECLSDQEQELMELAFMFRDAAFKAAGSDSGRYLSWSNTRPAPEARKIVLGTLLSMDPHKKIWGVRPLESHIPTRRVGDVKVTRPDGTVVYINLEDVAKKIHDVYFNGPYVYIDGADYVEWNYAAMGNPTDNDKTPVGKPIKKISTLLMEDFPDLKHLPAFMLDTLSENAIVCSEMRPDRYLAEYAGYNGSPIPGFDGISVEQASPIAACLYKAQAAGNLPKHIEMLCVTRLPSASRIEATSYNPLAAADVMAGVTTAPKYKRIPKDDFTQEPEVIQEWHQAPFEKTATHDEAVYGRSRFPENVRALLWTRDRFARSYGLDILPKVQLRGDLKIKPTLWDWIQGKWSGSSMPLGEITYHDYVNLEEQFEAFEKFVDSEFMKPTSLEQITPLIKELGNRIRDIKTYFVTTPPLLRDDESILIRIVQRMSLFYLKKLYKHFRNLDKQSRELLNPKQTIKRKGRSQLQLFADEALTALSDAKTIAPVVLKGHASFADTTECALIPILERCAGVNQSLAVLDPKKEAREAEKWIYFFDDMSILDNIISGYSKRSTTKPEEAQFFKAWLNTEVPVPDSGKKNGH